MCLGPFLTPSPPPLSALTHRYFWRGKVYEEPDDAERFAFFCRAALEFLGKRSHRVPNILHVHDWQAAAVVSAAPSHVKMVAACTHPIHTSVHL